MDICPGAQERPQDFGSAVNASMPREVKKI